MEDIRIYDFEFNLLKVCGTFLSSNWSIYYNDIGTFEAHFPLDDDVSRVLFSHDYLVAVQGNKSAIITGKQAVEDIAIFGRTPNWLFSKCVVLPFEELTDMNVEESTKKIISEAYKDKGIVGIPKGIMWGGMSSVTNITPVCRTDAALLSDVVKECLALDNAGHRLSFEPSEEAWVYTVLSGRKLPLVVSEDNLNAHNTQYTCDILDYCSGGLYKHQEEDLWVRVEKDDTKKGIYSWDGLLSGGTESEAKCDLSDKPINKQVTMQTHGLAWGVDYELGDIVTTRVIKGPLEVTAIKRIIGVNLWCEANNFGEEPIFQETEEV